VRSRAGYCPQCGASLNPEQSNPVSALAATVEAQPEPPELAMETAANAPGILTTEAAMAATSPSLAATSEENAPATLAMDENHAEGEDGATESNLATQSNLATDSSLAADGAAATAAAAPTRRHRVKVAARDAVEGKIAPRVEKLRHASTVMLDEAADDPGLRFVLVAAVLIIFSLILLLLSQILG
jgi:uncharacterized protein involved in copper resistance